MTTTIQQPNPEEMEEGQLYKVINNGEGLSLEKVEEAQEDKSYDDERRDNYKGQHYRRLPFNARYQKVTVVRAEIEMPAELYELVTSTILEYLPYRMDEFISEMFKQRMRQIMTDPKEFGELMLQSTNDAHCMQNCEW